MNKNLPVQDESVRYINPLKVRGIVLWYTEQIQVIALLLIADLKHISHKFRKSADSRGLKSFSEYYLSGDGAMA